VMLPVTIWLFHSGHNLAGSLFLIWAILVCSLDNFLRPILIRKGVELPMLLIITGVIGGLIGFGIIGLFIGPVILAVSFTLLRAWVARPGNLAAPVAAESPKSAAENMART
jgi:predicted PurR-regulated permease PerM